MQNSVKLKKIYSTFLFFSLFCFKIYAQESEKDLLYYNKFYESLLKYKIEHSANNLSKVENKGAFYLKNKIILDYYLKGSSERINISPLELKKLNLNFQLFYTNYLGDTSVNNDSLIYNNYLSILELARKKENIYLINETLIRILFYFFKKNNDFNYDKVSLYLTLLEKYKKNDFDNFYYQYLKNGFNFSRAYFEKTKYPNFNDFKICLKYAHKLKNTFAYAKVYQIIGATYTIKSNKKLDSAYFYFNKSKLLLLDQKSYYFKNILCQIYFNFGTIEYERKNYKKAIKLFKKSLNLKTNVNEGKLKYYRFISNSFEKIKKNDSALLYLRKHNKLKDSLNLLNQSIAISGIKEKYQTEKKEKENLQLKVDKEKGKAFLVASLLFILLAGTIGGLSLKNSKRKRKLAEQESELEIQKNLTLLKEQELTTINAMVDGQEKERKQIAEDLHDNLGSVLATLKLHFENLQMNNEMKKINQDELFNKTESLIDEAYLKVRSIAHAKNAGVIANQGLLTAVQMMAEKISSADKIKIEVIDFGLNKRLDNSLEIAVFRTIQELVTNIIKHAVAANVTINISLYDDTLNIIVEDDGKGFDTSKIDFKSGMGIASIKTRIQHLQGTFEIDTTLGKGTSILINIPVE